MTTQRGKLVLDASVAINMLATVRGAEVLGSLGWSCVIEDRAAGEVTRHPRKVQHPKGPLGEFLEARVLEVVHLEATDYDQFVQLVGAPNHDGLDDGEAASLAWATRHGGALAVDEAKARRIANRDFAGLELLSSLGLFKIWAKARSVSAPDLRSALQEARGIGRMRILHDEMTWWKANS
jgi:predicted nucleic acid-binding protein